MSERTCIFRRIRCNLGTARHPRFEYFEAWSDEWADWTSNKRKAHRFPDVGAARAHLAELRKHFPGYAKPVRIVRVMGVR